MTKVIIDDIEYTPRAEILSAVGDRERQVCESLVSSLYLYGESNARRLRHGMLEALEILSPDIYRLAVSDINAAMDAVRDPDEQD